MSIVPANAGHGGAEAEIISCRLHCTGDLVSSMCPIKGDRSATVVNAGNNAIHDQNRRCFVRQLQSTMKGHVGVFSMQKTSSSPAAHYDSQPGKCISNDADLNSFLKTSYSDGNDGCSLVCAKTAACIAYNYYSSSSKCEIFITGEAFASEAVDHLAGFSVSQLNNHSQLGMKHIIHIIDSVNVPY